MAVHLARRQRGQLAGGGLPVGALELAVALVDVERPAEGLFRGHLRVAQTWQPAKQHVDLQLRPLRRRLGRPFAEKPAEHERGHVGEHLASADGAAVRRPDGGGRAVGLDGDDLGARLDVGAAGARRRGETLGDGPHAADRHVPPAGAAPDHVVEVAPVRRQRLISGAGKRPDQRIGEDDPADRVRAEALLQQLAERPFEQCLPRVVVADVAAHVVRRSQRFGQRREHPLGNPCRHLAKGVPRLGVVAQIGAGAHRVGVVDEDSAVTDWRVRRDPPRRQRQVQAELVDDQLGEQADEVGVLRQPRSVAGEQLSRAGRPANDIVRVRGRGPSDRRRRGRRRPSARCAHRRRRRRRTGPVASLRG